MGEPQCALLERSCARSPRSRTQWSCKRDSARYSRWLRCPKRPPAGSCGLASEVTGPQGTPPKIGLEELSLLA